MHSASGDDEQHPPAPEPELSADHRLEPDPEPMISTQLFKAICLSHVGSDSPHVLCWRVGSLYIALVPGIEQLEPSPVLDSCSAAFVAVDMGSGARSGAAVCASCDRPAVPGLVSADGSLSAAAKELGPERCLHLRAITLQRGASFSLAESLQRDASDIGRKEGRVIRFSTAMLASVQAILDRRVDRCVAVRAMARSRRCLTCSRRRCSHVFQVQCTTGSLNASAFVNVFEQLALDVRSFFTAATRALTWAGRLTPLASSSGSRNGLLRGLTAASSPHPERDYGAQQQCLDFRLESSSCRDENCGGSLRQNQSLCFVLTLDQSYWVNLVYSSCRDCEQLQVVESSDLFVYSPTFACQVQLLQEALLPEHFIELSNAKVFALFLRRSAFLNQSSIDMISNRFRSEFANATIEYLRQCNFPYDDIIKCRCPESTQEKVFIGDGITLGHRSWRAALYKPHDARFKPFGDEVEVRKPNSNAFLLFSNDTHGGQAQGIRQSLRVMSRQGATKNAPSPTQLYASLVIVYNKAPASLSEYVYSVLTEHTAEAVDNTGLAAAEDLGQEAVPEVQLPTCALPLLQHLSTMTPVHHWLPCRVRPMLRDIAQNGATAVRSRLPHCINDLSKFVPTLTLFLIEHCVPAAHQQRSAAQQLLAELLEVCDSFSAQR